MFLRRLLSVVLCFLLLSADSGQMLYAHRCLKSNHTSFSLSKSEDCCRNASSGISHTPSVSKTSCCEISSKYLKQPIAAQTGNGHSIKLIPQVFIATQI